MSIREDFLSLLRSPQVTSINFAFLSMRASEILVDRTSFEKVVYAVEANRIRVISNTTGLGRGFDGQYQSSNQARCGRNRIACGNTMILPELTDIPIKGLAVHESVHASFDAGRFVLPTIDNEAASYIAQCIYLVNTGRTSITSNGLIHRKAFEIAILHRQTARIDNLKLNELRAAISQYPSYSSTVRTIFHGDGV